MKDTKYWIWFSKINGLGSVKKQKLLDIYGNPENIWNLNIKELIKIEGIGEKTAFEILNEKYRIDLDVLEERMHKENINIINICDKEYPEKLKQIYDKPISLYVKGDEKLLNKFCIGIIGCRENSEYGEIVAKAVGKSLAIKNIITISGLARGIDSISQKATIENNGKTIAVIGSGINNIYPYENIKLSEEIVKKRRNNSIRISIRCKTIKNAFSC